MGQRLPKANTSFQLYDNDTLATQAQSIRDGLAASATDYPTPPVDLATLQTLITNYVAALAAAEDGSKQDRANMHSARNILRSALRQEAYYVNQIVYGRNATGSSYADLKTLVLSSGFALSLDPNPVGPLPAPVIKKWRSAEIGQLYILLIAVRGAKSYVITLGITGTDESTWKTLSFANTRITIPGLTSGQSYSFRAYARGANPTSTTTAIKSQVII